MLETVEIFSHLSQKQIQRLEDIALVRHYASGEILFYQGDQSDYFHFLLEGDISVYKSNDTGTFEVHRFRGPSMFAESATLNGTPFPASAEALNSCVVLKLPRNPFLKLLHEDAGLSIALIASLSQKIASLQRLNEQLGAPDALSKIARLMLNSPEVFHHLKGVEIAKIAGIAPETLSRSLTKLKKESIIRFQPRKVFEILDKNALEKYR